VLPNEADELAREINVELDQLVGEATDALGNLRRDDPAIRLSARGTGRLRRLLGCRLFRRLLAALAVGPGLDVRNLLTCLLLGSDRCDGLVVGFDDPPDLAIGFFW